MKKLLLMLLLSSMIIGACGCGRSPKPARNVDEISNLVSQRQYEQASELISRDPRLVDDPDSIGRTPLMLAVAQQPAPLGFIQALLSKNADVNAKDHSGTTALMLAVQRGNADLVSLLLRSGADVRSAEVWRNTAFKSAVGMERRDIVGLLMNAGATPDIFDAAALGMAREVSRMVKHDRSLAKKRSEHGYTALQLAAFRRQANVIKVLLPLQEDLDACTAAAVGRTDALEAALAGTKSVDKETGNGIPPLLCAIAGGHKEAVALLLQLGAKVNGNSDNAAGFPLFAAIRNGDREIIELLLRHGADKDRSFPGFGTAYNFALAAHRNDLAELVK
jgi:ankyrin repeat protein